MILTRIFLSLLCIFVLLPLTSCPGAGSPPQGGSEITLDDYGIHFSLNEPWEIEVAGDDWTRWQRIQRGTDTEPWIFPPLTATKNEPGGMYDRLITWRFKGVIGTFDPTVNPVSNEYPVPEGLWHLNPQMLEMVESTHRDFTWQSMNNVTATCRLYENTHGEGEGATLWHTYVVTFNYDENAYEFVMAIPDSRDTNTMINDFWASIADFSITSGRSDTE